MGSHFKRLSYDGLLALKSGGLILVLGGLILLVFAAAYFVSKRIKDTSINLSELSGNGAHRR